MKRTQPYKSNLMLLEGMLRGEPLLGEYSPFLLNLTVNSAFMHEPYGETYRSFEQIL
jgi:hypothetical protein